MSYEIIYDKQFVKVNDDIFIPMILAGSNNCYEYSPSGKERRSRSWFNFSFLLNGAISGSIENMLDKQADVRANKIKQYPDEYKDKDFGYYTGLSMGGGCKVTYGQYIGIVKTGCKKALTIEQLKEEHITITISTYNSTETEDKLKEVGLEAVRFTPQTTKELEDFLIKVAPKYSEKGIRLSVDFNGVYESTTKRLRRKYFPKVKAEKQEVKSSIGYAIRVTKKSDNLDAYLYSYRGGTFRYSPYKDGGKQFLMKKDAEALAKKRNARRSDCIHTVEQVEYSRERTFIIPAGKKVTLPKKEKEKKMTDKKLIESLMLRKEGEEVANMFDPNSKCFLDPLGVALHDFIKGCEMTKKYDKMQQALSIFRTKYPEEYYVLLD